MRPLACVRGYFARAASSAPARRLGGTEAAGPPGAAPTAKEVSISARAGWGALLPQKNPLSPRD
eukprot:7214336-Pyramimonas_sp.AAC.1